MSIDKRLRDLRLEKNLTQKQVAEQLKISPTCYSGYEQGYREPDIKMMSRSSVLEEIKLQSKRHRKRDAFFTPCYPERSVAEWVFLLNKKV